MLEARDVMRVLENDPRAPNDLRQKALRLAGRLIECCPDVPGGDGFAIARDILDSGRALAKMKAIIAAQGEKPFDHNRPQLGALTFDVRATEPGVVTGDVLYRVRAGFQSDLDFARHACAKSTGYSIGRADEVSHLFVEF